MTRGRSGRPTLGAAQRSPRLLEIDRRSATVLALAALALAGCETSDDSPTEGRVKADCFKESPQVRPTREEVESFASVELPAGAGALHTSCKGFMDKSLQARFEIPADGLRAFLGRSGFRPQRSGEGRRLTREDRPKTVYRRLQVRISGDRALVRLAAFNT